jgi:hypothetical protein
MRVVTCPKNLVLHIDAFMLNPMAGTREEKLLSDWWSRCAPAAGLIGRSLGCGVRVTLSRPGRTWRLPFGRSMHCNLNLSGALCLPTGAMSSGSTYLAMQPPCKSATQPSSQMSGGYARGPAAAPSGADDDDAIDAVHTAQPVRVCVCVCLSVCLSICLSLCRYMCVLTGWACR